MCGQHLMLSMTLLATALVAQSDPVPPQANPTPPQANPTLKQLAALARERAKRQRPIQLEKLQPYLRDLRLNYEDNKEFLNSRMDQIVALGDSLLPVLLDMLTPSEEGDPGARNAADNTALILLRLDPSSFVNSLLEIAAGDNYTATSHAIWLLGHTKSQRAGHALIAILDTIRRSHRIKTIDALIMLNTPGAATKIALLLGSGDDKQRLSVLHYLASVQPDPGVLDIVLKTQPDAGNSKAMRFYIRYLKSAAAGNEMAAEKMISILREQNLDPTDMEAVIEAMTTIAPKRHMPTLDFCRQQIEDGESDSLRRACAVTMRDLGDKTGERILLADLGKQISRDRKDALAYVQRGKAYMALGRWSDATHDYESATRLSGSNSVQSYLWRQVAICEAHRKDRARQVLNALKKSKISYRKLRELADLYPLMDKVLDNQILRRWVKELHEASKESEEGKGQ